MPGDIFAVSGGLSPALEKVEDLDKVSRPTKVGQLSVSFPLM